MAGKSDGLRYALGRARLTGSGKTVYNHRRYGGLFVTALRSLGYGVQKWTNITNRHVAEVVAYWQKQGLKPGTIKNYLASIRAVCRAYGNDDIHAANDAFGVERRVYVTNDDKAVPDDAYEESVQSLRDSHDQLKTRVALMLEYQCLLGMRVEESMKFNPLRDDLGNTAHIHVGTKGGRPRWVTVTDERQRDLLERAKSSGFYMSPRATLIPKGYAEKQWRDYVYGVAKKLGLTKAARGATMHGLRHAYAHERYRQMTGFEPPACCASRSDFREQAEAVAGDGWRQKDELARCAIREELGHSPGRTDIDGQYLGKA